jgi:hypothetical protein
MRVVRCLLILLLALNLPGWAFAAMPGCSMNDAPMPRETLQQDSRHDSLQRDSFQHDLLQHKPTQAVTMQHDAAGMHCCADGASSQDQQRPGHCDNGASCQCGALYQALQPLRAIVVRAAPGIEQAPLFHVITASALPLWRPPIQA